MTSTINANRLGEALLVHINRLYCFGQIQPLEKMLTLLDVEQKKGKQITTSVSIPMGRKIRQSLILEQKRLAAKVAREARQTR